MLTKICIWVSALRLPAPSSQLLFEPQSPRVKLTNAYSLHACCMLSHFISDCVTPWTVARQAPLSIAFSRHKYWSGLPCPPPEDLPNPEIKYMPHVSCIGRKILYHYLHLGSQGYVNNSNKNTPLCTNAQLMVDVYYYSYYSV